MALMTTENPPDPSHALHTVKGVVTKFMRMLFPLEFRTDSLPGSAPIMPFHYPLLAGEMIYLPESVSAIGSAEMARDYYIVTAAHLAGRHEFATLHPSTILTSRAHCSGYASRRVSTPSSAGAIAGSRRVSTE